MQMITQQQQQQTVTYLNGLVKFCLLLTRLVLLWKRHSSSNIIIISI